MLPKPLHCLHWLFLQCISNETHISCCSHYSRETETRQPSFIYTRSSFVENTYVNRFLLAWIIWIACSYTAPHTKRIDVQCVVTLFLLQLIKDICSLCHRSPFCWVVLDGKASIVASISLGYSMFFFSGWWFSPPQQEETQHKCMWVPDKLYCFRNVLTSSSSHNNLNFIKVTQICFLLAAFNTS